MNWTNFSPVCYHSLDHSRQGKDHHSKYHHLPLVSVNVEVQVNIRNIRDEWRGLDISGPFISQLGHVTLPILQFLLGKPRKISSKQTLAA